MISSVHAASWRCRQQALVVTGFDQLVDEGGGGGEADRKAFLAGGKTQAQRDVEALVPALPRAITFSRRARYSHRASSSTSALLRLGRAVQS